MLVLVRLGRGCSRVKCSVTKSEGEITTTDDHVVQRRPDEWSMPDYSRVTT
jgi:hypothetical protein